MIIHDNPSVSNTISDIYFEFSDFVPKLAPDDLDNDGNDEDIDNVALSHDTASVADVSTLTDHSVIVLYKYYFIYFFKMLHLLVIFRHFTNYCQHSLVSNFFK